MGMEATLDVALGEAVVRQVSARLAAAAAGPQLPFHIQRLSCVSD